MPRKTDEAVNGTEKAAKAARTKAAKTATTAAKTPARRTTRKKAVVAELPYEHVATRAYFIHLESGGEPLENWLQAERELAVR